LGVLPVPDLYRVTFEGYRMKKLLIILFLLPVTVTAQRECVRRAYESQVGVKEQGNNSGKHVEMYLKTAGLKPGNPWCASFVYWCHRQCGTDLKISCPAMARSWYHQKRLVRIRNKSILTPQPADVVLFIYGKAIYHCGFYDSETRDFVITVEGNVSPGGVGGVHKLKRMKRSVYAITRWVN